MKIPERFYILIFVIFWACGLILIFIQDNLDSFAIIIMCIYLIECIFFMLLLMRCDNNV